MAWVAGIDGCPAGWFVVLRDTCSAETSAKLLARFPDALELIEKPSLIAVDIPIGLLETAVRGGRQCDRAAREILRPPRAYSVFSPPVRGALRYSDYDAANKANRASSPVGIGISKQSFSLREKLLEVDKVMTPKLQNLVREVHPELSFLELNGKRAIAHGKKKHKGLFERRELLRGVGFDRILSKSEAYLRSQVGEDDVLDACVACWSATRILKGDAVCIPTNPPCDSRGLRMEMLR